MERPVVALSWFSRRSRHLDETVIQRQIMPDGVLPSLLVLLEVWESVHDECVYLVEGHHARATGLQTHRNEGDVTVGRFHVRESALLLGKCRSSCKKQHRIVIVVTEILLYSTGYSTLKVFHIRLF